MAQIFEFENRHERIILARVLLLDDDFGPAHRIRAKLIARDRKRLVAVELGQDGEALFPSITLLKEQAEDLGRHWG